jgi:hypothetical protein
METYGFRTKAIAIALLGVACLTGCGERDYEGEGDNYRVVGIVYKVEEDRTIHINEKQLKVIEAAGKAITWFEEGKGQDWRSEEFNFDPDYNQEEPGFWGDCEHNVTVGEVYDLQGNKIDAQELQPGTVIEVTGRIRESTMLKSAGRSTYCDADDKNVFDVVQVINANAFANS